MDAKAIKHAAKLQEWRERIIGRAPRPLLRQRLDVCGIVCESLLSTFAVPFIFPLDNRALHNGQFLV